MSKKEKRTIDKKILVLILLIVLLLGSTYAWFTQNKNVSVEQLSVTVDSAVNLEISANATDWKTKILKDDIMTGYTDSKNQIPTNDTENNFSMVPVSTIGALNNGFLQMFKGEVIQDSEGNNKLKADSVTGEGDSKVGGYYIAFDMFFKVSNDATLYLDNGSGIIKDTGSEGIENATRIAIIKQGQVESTDSLAGILTTGTTATIIEPNPLGHTASGKKNALDTYGITIPETGVEKLGYNGIKAAISTENAQALDSEDTTYFGEVNTATISTTGNLELFELSKGITKARVYMWIEGQDVDCEDDASGADLKFDLKFTTEAN